MASLTALVYLSGETAQRMSAGKCSWVMNYTNCDLFVERRHTAVSLLTWTLGVAVVFGGVRAPGQAPAAGYVVTSPLPDIETLMDSVQQHEKRNEEFVRRYVRRTVVTTEMFQSDGTVNRRTVAGYDDYWSGNIQVLRLVEESGKALTVSDQAKEDNRIRKLIANSNKRLAETEDESDAGFDMLLMPLMKFGGFRSLRREFVKGRPTIAIDFVASPNAKTHNDYEKVVRQLAGTIWIDEVDQVVQQVEGRFVADSKVTGGMFADIGKGTTFSIKRLRIQDGDFGLWILERQQVRGHMRVAVHSGAETRMTIESSNYKRLRTNGIALPGVTLADGDEDVGDESLPPSQIPQVGDPK